MQSAAPGSLVVSVLWLALALGTAGCGGGEAGPRGVAGVGGNSAQGGPTTPPTLRTVAYLPSYKKDLADWAVELELANMSYINLAFVDVDQAGNVSYSSSALPGFVTAAHKAGAKVCGAIGGATTIDNGGVFATLLADDQRTGLVDNLVSFAKQNDLDCLDVDLEGNGVNEYYEAFVTELSAKLKPEGMELTAAVAAWFGERITPAALASFDFVNIMAYDLYSSRNDTPMQTSSIEAATREVDKWVARGLPREKAVYGVPFYGFQWPEGGGQPTTLGYSELLRMNAEVETADHFQTPGKVVYLNSRATIQAKARLAKGYGGIMAWEVGQDAAGDDSLLQAIREAVE